MPLNVLGSNGAIEALARHIEERHSKDPNYPWIFARRENDGPVLCGDEADLTEQQHRILIEVTKRYPDLAFVTGEVDRDEDTRELISANLVRYAKGRSPLCQHA